MKRKFEFAGPNYILEFIFISLVLNKNWKVFRSNFVYWFLDRGLVLFVRTVKVIMTWIFLLFFACKIQINLIYLRQYSPFDIHWSLNVFNNNIIKLLPESYPTPIVKVAIANNGQCIILYIYMHTIKHVYTVNCLISG